MVALDIVFNYLEMTLKLHLQFYCTFLGDKISSAGNHNSLHYSHSWTQMHSESAPRGHDKQVKIRQVVSKSRLLGGIFVRIYLVSKRHAHANATNRLRPEDMRLFV